MASTLARSHWSTRSNRRVYDSVSVQKPDEEIYTNGEPKLLRKKVIFPMGMTTGLCNLQARPVMQRQRSLFHVQEGNSVVTRTWNSATRQYRQVNATQGKRRNNLHFGTSYRSKKDTNHVGKFPEEFYAAVYGTFKLGDYDISPRTTRK